MTLQIEIKNAVTNTRTVTSNKFTPPKDFTFHTQPAYVTTYDSAGNQNPYPEMIELDLKENQPPFPVGRYTVLPQSFYVGDFKKLTLGSLHLSPAAAAPLVASPSPFATDMKAKAA